MVSDDVADRRAGGTAALGSTTTQGISCSVLMGDNGAALIWPVGKQSAHRGLVDSAIGEPLLAARSRLSDRGSPTVLVSRVRGPSMIELYPVLVRLVKLWPQGKMYLNDKKSRSRASESGSVYGNIHQSVLGYEPIPALEIGSQLST